MEVGNILKNIPDKRQNKNTTSLVFKKDLIEFFGDKYLDKKCYEIGTHKGYSTRVLSFLFKKVKTIDFSKKKIDKAKEFNKDRNNIEYICGDIYKKNIVKEKFNVFFVDCIHDTVHVLKDIATAMREGEDGAILIFDDYGLEPKVKTAIHQKIDDGTIEFVKFIGEPKGSDCRLGKVLLDWEGIICRKKV